MQAMVKEGIVHVRAPGVAARGAWHPVPALVPQSVPGRFTLLCKGKRPPLRAVARAQAARYTRGVK